MRLLTQTVLVFVCTLLCGWARAEVPAIVNSTPIVQLQTDDTLPIAPQRYDDAVEPPKENFTSNDHNDMWEKFERGELDQKAYVLLQDEYNAMASKDPKTRMAWLKRQAQIQKMIAKRDAGKKGAKTAVAKNAPSKKTGSRDIASVKGIKKPTGKLGKSAKPKKSLHKAMVTKTSKRAPSSLPTQPGVAAKPKPNKAVATAPKSKVPAKEAAPTQVDDDFKDVN